MVKTIEIYDRVAMYCIEHQLPLINCSSRKQLINSQGPLILGQRTVIIREVSLEEYQKYLNKLPPELRFEYSDVWPFIYELMSD